MATWLGSHALLAVMAHGPLLELRSIRPPSAPSRPCLSSICGKLSLTTRLQLYLAIAKSFPKEQLDIACSSGQQHNDYSSTWPTALLLHFKMVCLSYAVSALVGAVGVAATSANVNTDAGPPYDPSLSSTYTGGKTQSPPDITLSTANPLRTDHVLLLTATPRTDTQDPATATQAPGDQDHNGWRECMKEGLPCFTGGGKHSGVGSVSALQAWETVGIAVAVVAGTMAACS